MNRKVLRKVQHRPQMDGLTKGILAAFVVVGILLAIVGGKFIYNLVKGWTISDLPGEPVTEYTPVTTPGVVSTDSGPAIDPSTNIPTAKPWDGVSRVNILLLGLDYTDRRATVEGFNGPWHSDTMILASVDPLTNSMGILSIPRDLWVDIPGYDYGKINTAYFYGDKDSLPGGGAGLAIETVENFLGVDINFYVRIDLNAFTAMIDEIGGLKMNIQERIQLDPYGKKAPVWVETGEQVLPGYLALAYARDRSTAGGDFDRNKRQQEVIKAIIRRVTEFNQLPTLIANAPALYEELQSGISTNMSLDQIIQLALLITQYPQENLRSYYIAPPEMIVEGTVEGWGQVLIPVTDKIRILRDQMFAEGSAGVAPIVLGGSDLDLAIAESANIVLQNGTNFAGLADTTSAYLSGQGLTISDVQNGEYTTYTTMIIYNSTPYTASYLASLMNIPVNRIYNRYDPSSTTDIMIVLGDDWAGNNPMGQ
jgi:LCP family protein required for cell wall assembly